MTTEINLNPQEFQRLANNFYNSIGMDSYQQRINVDAQLLNYFFQNYQKVKEKKRVAFVWICLNPPYWEFAKPMIEGAKRLFLPGHDVDYFLWSDMPDSSEAAKGRIVEHLKSINAPIDQNAQAIDTLATQVAELHKTDRVTVFPLEPIEWPMPTLMRYHTFLQQEDILSKYDYVFYCDVDMAFVDIVGDEILGEGLTTGTNPMYYLDKTMYPPYEPNPESAAYIKRPGQIVLENGQPRFMPQYYAGGFQGGRTDEFIKAMKACKKMVDHDLNRNYIPIWNDESCWNKYIFENIDPTKLIVLNPSYIYPDSLHKEYYEPRWGRSYQPKLVTLTKKFSLKQLTPEEQAQITRMGKK